MTFRRINAPILLAILVFLGLVINSVVHYTSPVYRYYQENVKHVNDQYAELRRRLLSELVPFVQFSLTNRNDASFSSIRSVSSLSVSTNAVPLDMYLDFSFVIAGGDSFLRFSDQVYHLGDLFLGSPLVYISPTLAQTVERRFIHKSLKDLKGHD